MVFFKDITISGNTYLMIFDYEKQVLEEATQLRVHQSLIGPFAPDWPKPPNNLYKVSWTHETPYSKLSSAWVLESRHHRETNGVSTYPTLGRRIAEEKASWGNNVEFAGEFCHFQGYWEWTEDVLSRCSNELRQAEIYDAVYASLFTYDRNLEIMKAVCDAWCPSTNTLFTSSGELSISLWDLHILSGLPVYGTFYDEVVPCTKELLGRYKNGDHYIPDTCRHLFHAYHIVRSEAKVVTIAEWARFWSKKNPIYSSPSLHKDKKTSRSQSTNQPTGDLKAHVSWSDIETAPFVRLGLNASYWKEMYLAAHIACWLCCFVLPDGNANLIRPSTFKMANIMAKQRRVALTVPVLTSIYKGLNVISNTLVLSRAFPIHYVYSWVAHYFKTNLTFERKTRAGRMVQYAGEGGARSYDLTRARRRIFQGDLISWNCTMFTEGHDIHFVDNNDARESDQYFFMAIRSNYLVRRLEKSFSVEPYSPHRFSRQFGFYQLTPGVLSQDIREIPLDDGFKYWQICMKRQSLATACFPSPFVSAKKFVSIEYKTWWEQTYRNSLAGAVMTSTLTKLDASKERETVSEVNVLQDDTSKVAKKGNKIDPPKCDISPVNELQDDISQVGEKDDNVSPPEGGISKRIKIKIKRSEKDLPPEVDNLKDQEKTGDVNRLNDKRKAPSSQPDDSVCTTREPHFKRPKRRTKSKEDHVDGHSVNLSSSQAIKEVFGTDDSDDSTEPEHRFGAVSTFSGKAEINKHHKAFLQVCWSELYKKIMRTGEEFMSSIQEEILGGFEELKKYAGDSDLSYLENDLNKLFSSALAYDQARSLSSEAGDSHGRRFEELKKNARDVRYKLDKESDQIASIKKQIEELDQSLKSHHSSHSCFKNQLFDLEREIDALKATFEASESLKNL